ncbi:hypothetical protein J3R83DRAFT_13128 [Lanmaoa asiatica]|nr:hypothetical protein J3R83DRAFT_13128 [Lanmaoa asiatica]
MGFFSSRTSENTNLLEDGRSVVHVIRSRFYGKYKGKQRETFASISSPQLLHVGSKFQTSVDRDSLSHSSPTRSSRSPLRPLDPPSPRSLEGSRLQDSSTLAQRLDELAAANAEGLLNDEEYRLLRQNIFERLASGTSVPTETPLIPLGSHGRSVHEASQLTPEAYSPHQFQVKPRRTPSVRSKSSVTSAMSSLFKRGSRRISATSIQDSAISESSSIFSLGSLAPSPFKRGAIPPDIRSASPVLRPELRHDHNVMSTQSRAEHRLLGSISHHSISRSMRRLGTVTPPSSFPIRNPDLRHSPLILASDPSPDDEKVKSSQEIRLEIEAMEVEGRRLFDAFNGLELSALTRSQHMPGHAPLPRSPSISAMNRRNGGEYSDSFLTAGGSTSGRGTPYHGSDADGVSLRSTTSYGTNVSQPRSHRPNPSLRTTGPLAASTAANRKRSMSSLSSRARVVPCSTPPALAHVRLGELGSVSSVNLVRLQGSMLTMDEDTEMTALETELFDIRRRRQEVTTRYQDRLEYLRAQLKGAELREKLLRNGRSTMLYEPSGDGQDDGDNWTPTPGSSPTPATHAQPVRLPPTSRSHSAHRSAAEIPQHHHQGTSYFPSSHRSVSPTLRQPLRRSMSASSSRDRARSGSLSSTRGNMIRFREANILSEEQEDTESQLHDAVEDTRANRHVRGKAIADDSPDSDDGPESEDIERTREDDDLITLKDRQSLINVEHPFGLRIWKPALYKKSRSITRNADAALHSIPSAQAERHLLPGNIFWVVCFGWWLAVTCFAISAILYFVPLGGCRYSTLVFGLGWYVAWPFGKYVEGDSEDGGDEENQLEEHSDNGNGATLASTLTPLTPRQAQPYMEAHPSNEGTSLLPTAHTRHFLLPSKSYGATPSPITPISAYQRVSEDWLGRTAFWIAFGAVIAPLMLLTCVACWALIITIPMAKLNWALIEYIVINPTRIRFCSPPPVVIVSSTHTDASTILPTDASSSAAAVPVEYSVKHPRLSQGQTAPSTLGSPRSTVLLCVYRAIGWKYYKYTVGGVNIIFINLLPLVFFVIFDGFVLLPLAEGTKDAPAILTFLTSRALIFILSLASVIPLSYFIGMAVASISAQSSIGMGAVINATFGSFIEVVLYSIALTQGKGHLVEGSIVGSLLAGVLLMPGTSMCAGALRKKEQKFNAKSAGVTSMMLIMAFIGTLTPTLFYQIYGNFQLVCSGCPAGPEKSAPNWKCEHCYYQHPDPVKDPFYQSTVKSLMYFCAVILLFSYLVGLWFTLRTHATQIWQNPQPLLHSLEIPSTHRLSGYQRTSNTAPQPIVRETHKRVDPEGVEHDIPSSCQTPANKPVESTPIQQQAGISRPPVSPSFRRVSYAPPPPSQHFTPLMESVDLAIKNTQLPESLTKDDFTRAVAVATVSALRHQQDQAASPARHRASVAGDTDTGVGGHAGHEAPEWSRTTSAAVLLACTALYAIIAELLVDVVDFVLEGSGIDEKFLGITLFALVPNTTEFMNAISFALNGNIALRFVSINAMPSTADDFRNHSMEIGSAYALQVCLLQIPAMVAFSAWYAPEKMGEIAYSFTLIFPRWDVVVIILAVFLMTYTYIEAKSNYHRGSILILSYLVLLSGFYFAPGVSDDQADIRLGMRTVSSFYTSTQFLSGLWS